MGCPVCPIKELFSCPHGCVENTLTHFLFLLIEILAWMFNIWGAWKSHTVPCAFSGYHSDPPPPSTWPPFLHPQLWPIANQVQQSQIRSNTTKNKVLRKCPDQPRSSLHAADGDPEPQPDHWGNPNKLWDGSASTAMQPRAQEGSGSGRKHTTLLFSCTFFFKLFLFDRMCKHLMLVF